MESDNEFCYNHIPKSVINNKIRKLENKLLTQNQQIFNLTEKLACLNVANYKNEICVVQKNSKFLF